MSRYLCRQISTAVLLSGALALLAGCGGGELTVSAPATPVTTYTVTLTGSAHGGQQPIGGATIFLYAAVLNGYGASSMSLLNTPVTTNSGGSFSLPAGSYSCTAGQQIYVVAQGGNPGAGTNRNQATMAALGDCITLTSQTYVSMNEVTTVGSVFALAPFMSSYSAVGTSATNGAGLVRAFASVNKLVNVASGSGLGSALPAGAIGPSQAIYTLADVLASCINSTGGTAGDGSLCGNLFTLTTPAGGTAPTDVVQAALNIARNPTLNVTALYDSVSPASPYPATLPKAPADWTLAINYTGGFSMPRSTTLDDKGQVWVANAGGNTVTVLAQSGAINATAAGNGLTAPSAVAIDSGGNAWVANTGGSTVSSFGSTGAAGNTYAVGSQPAALAFDASGNLFVANRGSSNLSELNASGAPVQTVPAGVSSVSAIAIDPK